MDEYDPNTAKTIVDVLRERAAREPDATVFCVGDEALTFGQLYALARGLARGLRARGVGPGDRCALLMPTSLDLVALIYGVQLAGAAPVVMNPGIPAKTLGRRIGRLDCRLTIAEAGEIRADTEGVALEDLKRTGEGGGANDDFEALDPESIAYCQITSGTSGEPKAAMVRHRNLMAFLRSSQELIGADASDVSIGWVPLYHDLGLVRFVFSPLFAGFASHLLAPSIKSLPEWLRKISELGATLTGAPDFGYRIAARVVKPEGLDLSSLRFATNGGEPVRRGTIEAFEKRFGLKNVIRPGYGLAEATLGVTTLRPGEPMRVDGDGNVSCGQPYGGGEVKIAGEDGDALPAGQAGDIHVRGEFVFAGYYGDEETTRETLREGWLITGDVGRLDADGHLYVLGRKRALIKRAGAMIAPREVEEAADAAPGVRFSAAVGVAGETGGGSEELVLVAEIRIEEVADEEARLRLAAEIGERVAGAIGSAPGEVLLVKPHAIPRTRNGKIRYQELRRALEERDPELQEAVLFGRGEMD